MAEVGNETPSARVELDSRQSTNPKDNHELMSFSFTWTAPCFGYERRESRRHRSSRIPNHDNSESRNNSESQSRIHDNSESWQFGIITIQNSLEFGIMTIQNSLEFGIMTIQNSKEFRIMTIQNLSRFRITANYRITTNTETLKPRLAWSLTWTTGCVSRPATRMGRRRHGRRRARPGGGTATEKLHDDREVVGEQMPRPRERRIIKLTARPKAYQTPKGINKISFKLSSLRALANSHARVFLLTLDWLQI